MLFGKIHIQNVGREGREDHHAHDVNEFLKATEHVIAREHQNIQDDEGDVGQDVDRFVLLHEKYATQDLRGDDDRRVRQDVL